MTLIKSISGIRGTIGGRAGDTLNPLDIVRFTSAYAMFIRKNGAGPIKENAQKIYDCICRGDAEAAVKESVHAMELATSGSTSII